MQATEEKTTNRRRGMAIIWRPYFYGAEAYCPKCDGQLGYDYSKMPNFCPHCGQKLEGGRYAR